MSRFFHHKKITAVAVIGLLVVAGGAYAYWTTAGIGQRDRNDRYRDRKPHDRADGPRCPRSLPARRPRH